MFDKGTGTVFMLTTSDRGPVIRTSSAVIAGIVCALALFFGCPSDGDMRKAPVNVCTEIGTHCIHSPGKLGICGTTDDSACGSPPCLECVNNH